MMDSSLLRQFINVLQNELNLLLMFIADIPDTEPVLGYITELDVRDNIVREFQEIYKCRVTPALKGGTLLSTTDR